jgi:hypothetical protein
LRSARTAHEAEVVFTDRAWRRLRIAPYMIGAAQFRSHSPCETLCRKHRAKTFTMR